MDIVAIIIFVLLILLTIFVVISYTRDKAKQKEDELMNQINDGDTVQLFTQIFDPVYVDTGSSPANQLLSSCSGGNSNNLSTETESQDKIENTLWKINFISPLKNKSTITLTSLSTNPSCVNKLLTGSLSDNSVSLIPSTSITTAACSSTGETCSNWTIEFDSDLIAEDSPILSSTVIKLLLNSANSIAATGKLLARSATNTIYLEDLKCITDNPLIGDPCRNRKSLSWVINKYNPNAPLPTIPPTPSNPSSATPTTTK
jgi:hypothetical protein